MKQAESFASLINRAQELPDDTGEGANVSIEMPRLFDKYPIPDGEQVITDEKPPGAIKNVPTYNFKAKFQRFIMGQVEKEVTFDKGKRTVEYEERDDSALYENLLNDVLQGKAILRYEEKQTLKDGTFVISVSYLVPKEKPKPKGDV